MIPDLRRFINFKNFLFQFFLYLSFFSFISLADLMLFEKNPSIESAYVFRFISSIVLGFFLFYLSRKKFGFIQANPFNFLVSTLIIFLLIHPSEHIYFLYMAIFFAWLGKRINVSNQPVFNPAALGIFLTFVVTLFLKQAHLIPETLLISWWGADMQQKFAESNRLLQIGIPFILLGGFMYFTDKFKKGLFAATFFITFILLSGGYYYVSSGNIVEAVRQANISLFNSTAFLILVMLSEPKTSPVFPRQQSILGILGGILLFIFIFVDPISKYVFEPFIVVILLTNIATFFLKQQKLLK